MYELRNLAQQLRTFSAPLADATPELRDAIILRTWLQNLHIAEPSNGGRIFGPSLTPVIGNRICMDGAIRNNPWIYLEYLVYVHIDSWKSIYELVTEKCPAGFTVRDTYNRYNPPSVRAAPLILIMTLTKTTKSAYDVFELQDFFKLLK